MCGQYIPLDYDEFDKCAWALAGSRAEPRGGEPHDVIYPSQTGDIISRNGAEKGIFGMKLSGGALVINARIEGLASSRMFAPLLEKGRCVVPASAYFEWMKNGRQRSKYRLFDVNGDPLFFAGLLREGRFVIITADAAPEIREIHPRMPRCLTADEAEKWLFEPPSCVHGMIEGGQSVSIAATPVRA